MKKILSTLLVSSILLAVTTPISNVLLTLMTHGVGSG